MRAECFDPRRKGKGKVGRRDFSLSFPSTPTRQQRTPALLSRIPSPLASMKRSAFTLVELLVVISIIAILAGIALPVFSRVLERGKVASDGSNLHQLGVGLTAYLNDNDDQMFVA